MTTEAKAQELIMKVHNERGTSTFGNPIHRTVASHEALCRAIEQHEAFRQEVSDIVYAHVHVTRTDDWEKLKTLIIPKPKPDPLVEVISEIEDGTYGETKAEYAAKLRAALDAAGFEIREKNDDQH